MLVREKNLSLANYANKVNCRNAAFKSGKDIKRHEQGYKTP